MPGGAKHANDQDDWSRHREVGFPGSPIGCFRAAKMCSRLPGEPRDLADRGWHAGLRYRDVAALFDQARERLKPDGCMYVMLSSDSDLELLGQLIDRGRLSRPLSVSALVLYRVHESLRAACGLATHELI
jgi:hypothetical protein